MKLRTKMLAVVGIAVAAAFLPLNSASARDDEWSGDMRTSIILYCTYCAPWECNCQIMPPIIIH